MNIDRKAFLAIATLIAGATTACASTTTDAGSGESDITASAEGGPSLEGQQCVPAGTEEAYPFKEGDCFDLFRKGMEEDYRRYSSVTEGGKTLAETEGCQPESFTHPADETSTKPICPFYTADFAMSRCRMVTALYKKTAATNVLKCWNAAESLDDSIYDCEFQALDQTCAFYPTAESSCTAIETALKARSIDFGADMSSCEKELGALRKAGRDQILAQAKNPNDAWYGLHSAVESLGLK